MYKKIVRAGEKFPAITAPIFTALLGLLSLWSFRQRKEHRGKSVVARALPSLGLTKEVLAGLPRQSYHAGGDPMESMNVILLGSKSDIRHLYQQAGWFEALPVSLMNLIRAQLALILNMQFLHGPVTPLYVGLRQQDLAFQKPTDMNKFKQRHHMRLWKTDYHGANGQQLWIGQASYDIDIKRAGSFIKVPVHEVDANIDTERDILRADLVQAGGLDYGYVRLQGKHKGTNAFDDAFISDGRAAVIGVEA